MYIISYKRHYKCYQLKIIWHKKRNNTFKIFGADNDRRKEIEIKKGKIERRYYKSKDNRFINSDKIKSKRKRKK